MAITHADSKTDNKIPDIAKIPAIEDEIKKEPTTNNTKEEADLEKADRPADLWETFLERRKMQGAGDARYGNVHETGMEQDPVSDKTYIGKPTKENNEDDK